MEHNIPAFPFTANVDDKPNQLLFTGMTLRDYFAASALTGYLAAGAMQENAVVWSYRTAQRMLEERAKRMLQERDR
jgi:hypothetical protein